MSSFSKNESMSRYAHRHIKDAFSKAERSRQFSDAQNAAQLSDRARQSKWHKRWARLVFKFFGGGYDQQINKTAFGQHNVATKQSQTKAMKIQKIYGFIRLISKLDVAFPTTNIQLGKHILLQTTTRLQQEATKTVALPSFYITISEKNVRIRFIKDFEKKVMYELNFNLKSTEEDITMIENLPALSKFDVADMLKNPKNADAVREIYKHINSFAKKLHIEPLVTTRL